MCTTPGGVGVKVEAKWSGLIARTSPSEELYREEDSTSYVCSPKMGKVGI